MEYKKPQLMLSVAAVQPIRGTKGLLSVETAIPDARPSTAAYEADE